jgi:hypothetical protein
MLNHAKITVTAQGTGQIVIDDHDVSSAVRGFSIDAFVGELTQLRLELLTRETVVDGKVQIRFDPVSEQLLETLGWNRPAETQGE